MSLSTATLKRLPKIKHGLIKGWNREQIGAKCEVTEKTIDRDMEAWVQSGLFEVWIKEEFLRLHPKVVKEDIVEAYRNISKLVGKMITRKFEAKTEYKEEIKQELTINFNELPEDERKLLEHAVRVYLKGRSATRPSSIR